MSQTQIMRENMNLFRKYILGVQKVLQWCELFIKNDLIGLKLLDKTYLLFVDCQF